jgi:hypothetical protein
MSASENQQLIKLLEEVDQINTIPLDRKYWLVRTQAGVYFESFVSNDYIGINYNEVPYSEITRFGVPDEGTTTSLVTSLKDFCARIYPEDSRPGLIASQLIKFTFSIKRGDIVIIPSENSEVIALGYVTDTPIYLADEKEVIRTSCPFIKRKVVVWDSMIPRDRLDPFLYRVLQAHQAINDISSYANLIERNLRNFFISDGIGNLVLNVRRSSGLNASDVFELGHNLLRYASEFLEINNLPYDFSDLEVKISLNSEGKIHFKTSRPALALVIGLLLVGLAGGGLRFKAKDVEISLETNGVIKAITDYQNNAHDRHITDTLVYTLDSLKVQSPEDAIKVLQQFATNKPK